jgi:cyanoexosortase A
MQHLKQLFLGLSKGVDKKDADFGVSLICLSILVLIHFSLGIYLGKQAYLMMSLLLWGSLYLLLWDRRQSFKKNQDKISSFLGYLVVTVILVLSVVHPGEKELGFFPLAAFLGWFLIFIGASQAKFYLKEFCILTVFGIPKLIPDTAFGLAPVTAKFSAYTLWYLGYQVSLLNNIYIQIPNGGVEVIPACSGINLVVHMLSISVIFLCVFPTGRSHTILFVVFAVILGFFMNVIRVAMLAALSTPKLSTQFHYWHSASGASLFVLLTLVIYGVIYFSFLKPAQLHRES